MRTDTTNPYVGLRPYDTDESLLFFGRNDQTMELLQRLHQHHFVAVVGSSGCGKSSLLRAGLIPALKAGYLVNDSDLWSIAIMKPGQSPLYNLAESMLLQLNSDTDQATISKLEQEIIEEGADALLRKIIQEKKEQSLNFFLLVDQFEELFRFAMEQNDVGRKDEAIDFVSIILELSQQKLISFYVVITMRSDFIGDCARFYGLPEAMNQSQYLVPRLNRVQLKSVIESPARLYGGKLNPSITSLLLNESGKVKDELPLLQHALMRMWDFEMNVNQSGEIDFLDYESIGGIEKALSNHADEALAGMNEEDLMLAKKIFQSLTAIDENGRKIRRPVLLSQLKELTGANEEQLLAIINLFIKDKRSFLVVTKAADTGDKIIDISHESLIRQWNTLCLWVDEEAESVAIYLRLAESTRLHKQNEKDFLSGSELQIASYWYLIHKPIPSWANRYREGFDESIKYLSDSEKEKIRLLHKEKSRKRTLQLLTGALAVIILVAIGAALKSSINEVRKKSADLKIKNDSLTDSISKVNSQVILTDSIERFGISKQRAQTFTQNDFRRLQELNNQIDKLTGKIDTSFTIMYFPKLSDQDRALTSLNGLGYKLVILEPKENMANTATNSIWLGTQGNVKIENVKLISLYLMRAGIKIKAIRLFQLPDQKAKVIQVGADMRILDYAEWTLDDVLKATRFDRMGKPHRKD